MAMRPPQDARPARRALPPALLAVVALAVAGAGTALPTGAAMGAGTQPLDEIARAAIAAVGAADADAAEATLDPSLRLARCGVALHAVATGLRTARVECPDDPGWRLYVPVRVRREADVVVLRTPAPAGAPITADQLQVQRRDVGAGADAAFSDPAALVGRVPRQALAAGAVPAAADLAQGSLLRRGDPLVLVSRAGAVEVRVAGRALGPARAGGIVPVQNAQSQRVLRGRLVEEGVVELLP